MNGAVFASRTATAAVAGVAGFASYRHIMTVADRAGETFAVASVLPLAIDGLIVVATLAMLEDKRARRAPRLSARLALVFGVLATLAANIASAHGSWTARAVAAVPAVSFLLAVEVLARKGRPLPANPTGEPVPEPTGEPVGEPTSEPTGEPVAGTAVEPLATPAGRRTAPRVKARSLSAAERVKAAHERYPEATHQRIADLAGVSLATVKRHRPTGSPSGPSPAQTPDSTGPVDPPARVNGSAPSLAAVAA